MAKGRSRTPQKSDALKKSAQDQAKGPEEGMEATPRGGKAERKQQVRKFGHN